MNTDDITPNRVYRETSRWSGPALVTGVALIIPGAILTFIGWRIGWRFTAQDAIRLGER